VTDSRPNDARNDQVDPERVRDRRPFDKDDHFTGQTYHRDAEKAMGDAEPGYSPQASNDPRDVPPDDGRRASIGPNGAVHGSGSGIGGGNPGEDIDSSSASGGHSAMTGGEGGDGDPGDLGPVREE